jgi:alpha-beta hydrolase superfamily lysophospholipase
MLSRLAQFVAWALAVVLIAGAALWLLVPREPVDRNIEFDPSALPAPSALPEYLASAEARFDDIRPGQGRQIVWAGEEGERTAWSVLYVHGFSASPSEIRPVPERVADALGANLHFLRLRGHGRGGAAMAEPVAGDWLEDMAEGLAIARSLGDRILVVSTSFGGTLTAGVLLDAELADLREGITGAVLIAPNFRLRHPLAPLMELPGARWIGPLLAGQERGFPVKNEGHAANWTTRYPTVAAAPMAATMRYARGLDASGATVPALFVFSAEDRVVDTNAAVRVARRWGAPSEIAYLAPGPGDDPNAHVLGGDILSPGLTGPLVDLILGWTGGLD